MEVQRVKTLEVIANPSCGYLYHAYTNNFKNIPGSPVAYWVGKAMLRLFNEQIRFTHRFNIKAGISTGKNDEFIFYWFEVGFFTININTQLYHFTVHNKGGEFCRWYGNRENILKYNDFYIRQMEKNIGFRHDGKEHYFREHIGWSKITSYKSSFRLYDDDFTFDSAGLSLFANNNNDLIIALGFLNTKIVDQLLTILNPTLNCTPQSMKKLPFPLINGRSKIEGIVLSNINLSRTDWDSFETSWDFKRHPLIPNTGLCAPMSLREVSSNKLSELFNQWQETCEERFQTLKSNEEELNRIFIEIYGLQDELTPEVADKDVTVRRADLGREIRSLISYAVGCMFGRYSLDVEGLAYAGGEWDNGKYKTFIPEKNNIILITNEDYNNDIVSHFTGFIKTVYGEKTMEDNLNFIARAVNNRGGNSRDIIRDYFLNDFYKDHVKIYRKRPIYWLFDSGKENGFKALIYMHRYQADTIGSLRIEYLHKMQNTYESEIGRMRRILQSPSSAVEKSKSQKRLEKLQRQLRETKTYDEKIAHLTLSRIEIDLDDGVKLNYEKVQTAQDGKKLEVLGKIG
jgi:hypothetical protein